MKKEFDYKAIKDKKEIIEGKIEAENLQDAKAKIRELNLIPLNVYESENLSNKLDKNSNNCGHVKFLSLQEKISFVSELQVMLASGISIIDALATIEHNVHSSKLKRISIELQRAITNGKTFTEAVNYLYHDLFGDTFIDLCATGEVSGELETTLERLVMMLKKQDEIKGSIIQALIYPCILIVIMFILLVGFSKFVFPKFINFIIENGADIPPFANAVVGTLHFVDNYWWFCLLIILAIIGLVNFLAQNTLTRTFFDKLFLKLPIINDFVNYINLSNYVCVLSVSYTAGVPFIKGLELAERTIGNTEIRKKAKIVNKMMEKGNTLSYSLNSSNLLPGALVTMISAGEKAGNLSKMLDDCVTVIDKKINMVLQALTKAFEPALIITLGIFVLVIAIAFMQMYISMIKAIA